MMEAPEFRFDADSLDALARSARADYEAAQPFPHAVFDDFLPADVFDKVASESPVLPVLSEFVMTPTTQTERGKTAHVAPNFFGPHTTNLLYQLNGAVMLDFLEKLTGIGGLIADTRLDGGGYHLTRRGGRLAIHTDFSHHRRWRLRRRLNIILYLNRDWPEAYGGHLELWDQSLTHAVVRVLPTANRCVIFNTDRNSPHGQPDPLNCPPERGRESLALYYYDNPLETVSEIGTNYMKRPAEQNALRFYAKKLLPPIVYDLRDALRGRR